MVPEKRNTMQWTFSSFSCIAKRSRHGRLESVTTWQMSHRRTCTTTYTHNETNEICLLAVSQLSNSYYKNHLSPDAFFPFKLCLRWKTVGRNWMFFRVEGRVKGHVVSLFCYTTWSLSGGFELGQEVSSMPGEDWSNTLRVLITAIFFAMFLHLIPSFCCCLVVRKLAVVPIFPFCSCKCISVLIWLTE